MNKLLNLLIVLLILALGSLFYLHREDQNNLAESLQSCKEKAEPFEQELADLEIKAAQLKSMIHLDQTEEDTIENQAMVLVGYYITSLEAYESLTTLPIDEHMEPILVIDCQAEDSLLSQVGASIYPCVLTGTPSPESLTHAVALTGSKCFLLRDKSKQTKPEELENLLETAGIHTTIPYIKSVGEENRQIGYSFISSKRDSLNEDYEYIKKFLCPLLYVFDLTNMMRVDGSLAYMEECLNYLVEGSNEEEAPIPLVSLQTALDTCSLQQADIYKVKSQLKEIQARIKELNHLIKAIYHESL